MRSTLNNPIPSPCPSDLRITDGPWIAPVTTAVTWDGHQWRWTQWTGADWIDLPRNALQPTRGVTQSGGTLNSTYHPDVLAQAPLGGDTLRVAPRRSRTRNEWPGPMAMLMGHVVAALMGLTLGYYVLCCLRPAEFNRWDLPIPARMAASVN